MGIPQSEFEIILLEYKYNISIARWNKCTHEGGEIQNQVLKWELKWDNALHQTISKPKHCKERELSYTNILLIHLTLKFYPYKFIVGTSQMTSTKLIWDF